MRTIRKRAAPDAGSLPLKGADEATKDAELAHAAKWMAKGKAMVDGPLGVSRVVKYSTASLFYENAARQYVRRSRWRQGAEAFAAAGEAEALLGDRGAAAAALFFESAGDALSKVDVAQSVAHYRKAVDTLSSKPLHDHVAAASISVSLAAMLARDGATEEAAAVYAVAAEQYLEGGGAPEHTAPLCRCLHEAGSLYALCGEFERAHRCFDRAAGYARGDNLLKHRSPDLVLQAALCIIGAGDLPSLGAYCDQGARDDPNFSVGRERRFLLDIADCAKHYDLDTFLDHVWNFDYVRELAPFELTVLKHTAETIKAGPPDPDAAGKEEDVANARAGGGGAASSSTTAAGGSGTLGRPQHQQKSSGGAARRASAGGAGDEEGTSPNRRSSSVGRVSTAGSLLSPFGPAGERVSGAGGFGYRD